MQTVLPREEAVEAVISKVLGSQEACDRLNEVFLSLIHISEPTRH